MKDLYLDDNMWTPTMSTKSGMGEGDIYEYNRFQFCGDCGGDGRGAGGCHRDGGNGTGCSWNVSPEVLSRGCPTSALYEFQPNDDTYAVTCDVDEFVVYVTAELLTA